MPFEMDLWETKLAIWKLTFFFFNVFESLTDKKGFIFKIIHFSQNNLAVHDIFIRKLELCKVYIKYTKCKKQSWIDINK